MPKETANSRSDPCRWSSSGVKQPKSPPQPSWRLVAKALSQVTSWTKTVPLLYVPLRCRFAKDVDGVSRALTADTELVIDAYPRSGNSFATAAFQLSQPRPVRLAHHFHAAAAVLYAVRHRIPTLTLLRNPDDACVSCALWLGQSDLRHAFAQYSRLYRAIAPHRNYFVLAKFDSLIGDFGQVVKTVNRRFSTDFVPFVHCEENVNRVKKALQRRMERRFDKTADRAVRGSTPSLRRDSLKTCLRSQLNSEALRPLRQQAQEIYWQLRSHADI